MINQPIQLPPQLQLPPQAPIIFENQQHIHDKLDFFYKSGNVPNILLYGPTGSGKSTMIHHFIQNIFNRDATRIHKYTKYIDCTHSKGIKFIREDLKFFAQSNIIDENTFKIIILQNADNLTIDAQSALRRYIEIFIKTTRFIIDISDQNKLIKPILSRFCTIYVPLPISNNKVVNLYKLKSKDNPNHKTLVKLGLTKHDNIRKKIKHLIKKSKEKEEDVFAMADGLCAAGVSSLDIIPLIENGILTQNNTSLQYDILYAFNNIQKEIRCEKILISLLLQCIFSQTNIIQEQQLDI